ncbi:MAG: site-specific integrase [Bifidobacteriaceae bacterium]|jgi:site-specific recombinase XerD|nr:site-specific integrase [Bifidobacteriaceae bacterium]
MNTSFPSMIAAYLTVYLPRTAGCSPNTVASYRDAFVLFLGFCQQRRGRRPDKIGWEDFAPAVIEEFLSWLETEKRSSAATRNQRLAAIKAFLRYTQAQSPELIDTAAPVLAIRSKKAPEPAIRYLSIEQIKLLLDEAERSGGTRDLALITLLYDTAARVQEIADLRVGDLALAKPATAQLTGKGRKTRVVPLTPQAAAIVARHVDRAGPEKPVFTNRSGRPIGRGGITWILQRHANAVAEARPSAMPRNITPHVLRHSKAMHLLEHGVNLINIRDLLGHASVVTTEVYAKANPEARRAAIEAASNNIITQTGYDQATRADLLNWLKGVV